jgi:hypothetical protein
MYVRSLPSARVRVTHVIRVGTSNGTRRASERAGACVPCPSGRPGPVPRSDRAMPTGRLSLRRFRRGSVRGRNGVSRLNVVPVGRAGGIWPHRVKRAASARPGEPVAAGEAGPRPSCRPAEGLGQDERDRLRRRHRGQHGRRPAGGQPHRRDRQAGPLRLGRALRRGGGRPGPARAHRPADRAGGPLRVPAGVLRRPRPPGRRRPRPGHGLGAAARGLQAVPMQPLHPRGRGRRPAAARPGARPS